MNLSRVVRMLLEIKVLIGSVALLALGCVQWCCRLQSDGLCYPGVFAVACLLAGFVLADIYRLKPGASHSVSTIMVQYMVQKLTLIFGTLLHVKLRKLSHDVEQHQAELLMKILKQNTGTKLHKYLNLSAITNVYDFKARVPLTRYATYKVFVVDIENNGTENVFFPGKTDYIAVTSGTSTGTNKRFPKSLKLLKQMGKLIVVAQRGFLRVPRNNYLRKLVAMRMNPKFWFSKSGIKCGPISGLSGSLSLSNYVAPAEIAEVTGQSAALYLNVLFGLKEQEICNLFFSTSAMALWYFQTMEGSWQLLCRDIAHGEISEFVDISCDLRKTLNRKLGPGDPQRAAFLRNIFTQRCKDVVPRIWPSCPALFCLATGSFAPQAKIVKEHYLGDVDIISPFHAGTETMYGTNLHVQDPDTTYVAATTLNFFEFIPADEVHLENPKTCFAHEVKVGCEYELVVTTWEGLYRYRTEDVVLVTGFMGTIPRYKFSRRSGDILVCGTARLPESVVSCAVTRASQQWGLSVAGFTCTESIHMDNVIGHVSRQQNYVILLELVAGSPLLTETQISLIDEEIVSQHESYARYRKNGHLGPVKVVQLQSGTLTSANFRSLENPNSSCMQYKLPRIIRREAVLKYLIHNSVGSCETEFKTP